MRSKILTKDGVLFLEKPDIPNLSKDSFLSLDDYFEVLKKGWGVDFNDFLDDYFMLLDYPDDIHDALGLAGELGKVINDLIWFCDDQYLEMLAKETYLFN